MSSMHTWRKSSGLRTQDIIKHATKHWGIDMALLLEVTDHENYPPFRHYRSIEIDRQQQSEIEGRSRWINA